MNLYKALRRDEQVEDIISRLELGDSIDNCLPIISKSPYGFEYMEQDEETPNVVTVCLFTDTEYNTHYYLDFVDGKYIGYNTDF